MNDPLKATPGGRIGGVLGPLRIECEPPPDPQAPPPGLRPGQRVTTVEDLKRFSPAALQRVVTVLAARPKLTPEQLALLVAAANRLATRQPAVGGIDPAARAKRQAAENLARSSFVHDLREFQKLGGIVESFFDSADTSTPTAPNVAINKALELAIEGISKPAGVIVEVATGGIGLPEIGRPVSRPTGGAFQPEGAFFRERAADLVGRALLPIANIFRTGREG